MTTATEPLLLPRTNKPNTLQSLLQQAHAARTSVMVPGVFNALVAKLAEAAGFSVLYVSGAGLSNTVGGYPDIGLLSGTEMIQQAGYIARATHCPVIADADTGFGEAIQTFRAVQHYEREGVSGIHLEDQVFPKRCGHLDGKQVVPTEVMVQKLQAACAARTSPDFLIMARTDAKSVEGMTGALARARAYADAGAGAIFPEALTSEDDFVTFARDFHATHPQIPLLANMTEFGKSPLIPAKTLGEMGYAITLYPMTMCRIMLQSMQQALHTLATDGVQTGLISDMMTRQTLYETLHYSAYANLDAQLAAAAPQDIPH